jgi:hypothetical protein
MGESPLSLGFSSTVPPSLDLEQLIFYQACDGMGKCVVVVKAENGRIAAAYNEDGFTSDWNSYPNLKGFLVSVDEDGGVGEIFYRNDNAVGVLNHYFDGPWFGDLNPSDLYISDNWERSRSRLGGSYGRGTGLNHYALFGQERFRVVDYEVFKIVIEYSLSCLLEPDLS